MKREITAKAIAMIDKRLAGNGAAQDCLKKKGDLVAARELFTYVMESLVGIREKGGNNKGPEVQLLQDTIGGVGSEAWCMSTVQTGIAYVEVKLEVDSLIPATEHCMTCWNTAPKVQRVKEIPARGAIVIWRHGETTNGHTGIFLELHKTQMTCIEGNTEAGLDAHGDVKREGGGVYKTTRGFTGNGSMKVVGFLKPF